MRTPLHLPLALILALLAARATLVAQTQWEQIGPAGGYVGQLAADENGGTLYAHSGAAFYRSVNGNAWELLHANPSAINGGNFSHLLVVGTVVLVGDRRGIPYRSYNQGETFLPPDMPPGDDTNIVFTSIYQANGKVVAVDGAYNIYRSADTGRTWQNVGQSFMPFILVGATEGTLYGSTAQGLERSTDYGNTWEGLGLQGTYILRAGHAGNAIIGVAGTAVWRSTNSGATWDTVNLGAPVHTTANLGIVGNAIFVTVYSNQHRGMLVASTDRGETWGTVSMGLNGRVPGATTLGAGALYTTTRTGVYRANAATLTWQPFLDGLVGRHISNIVSTSYGLVAQTDEGMYRSSNDGTSWETDFIPSGQFIGMHTAGDTITTTFLGGDAVYRTTNGGANWQTIPVNGEKDLNLMHAFSRDSIILVSAAGKGLYRSSDNGATWELLTSPFANQGTRGITADGTAIIIDLNGVQNGVLRSLDGGKTWQAITEQDIHSSRITLRNGVLYRSSLLSGIYRSADYGVTWEARNNGLPNAREGWTVVTELAFLGDTLLAVIGDSLQRTLPAQQALYYSANEGASWEMYEFNEDVIVNTILRHNGLRYAATTGDGVLREMRPSAVPGAPRNQNQLQTELGPNPTHGNTTLTYTVPQRATVQLQLYTPDGRLLATLPQGTLEQGRYSIPLDLQRYPNGTYHLRLRAGDTEQWEAVVKVE